MFCKDDVICVVYVDDTLFFAKDREKVNKVISQLQKLDFELTDEGDVEAFLGIKVDQLPDGTIKMSQPDLINRVIQTLGLENQSKQRKLQPFLHCYMLTTKEHPERKHGTIGQL